MRAKAVVYVTGRDVVTVAPGENVQGVQQHSRIQTAGIADKQLRAVFDVPGKARRYSPKYGLSGWVVP